MCLRVVLAWLTAEARIIIYVKACDGEAGRRCSIMGVGLRHRWCKT